MDIDSAWSLIGWMKLFNPSMLVKRFGAKFPKCCWPWSTLEADQIVQWLKSCDNNNQDEDPSLNALVYSDNYLFQIHRKDTSKISIIYASDNQKKNVISHPPPHLIGFQRKILLPPKSFIVSFEYKSSFGDLFLSFA